MAYYEFTACRVSGDGNAVFPDKIIIDDEYVIYRKSRVIGRKDIKFSHEAVSCVTLNKYMLFVDINTDTSRAVNATTCKAARWARVTAASTSRTVASISRAKTSLSQKHRTKSFD